MYEVVNKQDGSRMSRPNGRISTTLFPNPTDAAAWMKDMGLTGTHEVRPV